MTERTCGECYKCCVALGIRELKKYQDRACRHLDGRNPAARCSIYNDRPAACRNYICLWREGVYGGQEDRPDKSGVMAHIAPNADGVPGLMLTIDRGCGDETLERVHRAVADYDIGHIGYRFTGTNKMMIQVRGTGKGVCATFIPTDYEDIRFIDAKPMDFTGGIEIR